MGLPVLITGKSGSGKSTSLRNFGEDEITVVNVTGKIMPFPKVFKDSNQTDDYQQIADILNSSKSTAVIDDAGYLLVNQFMRGHSKHSAGNAIFNFYNQIADNFWKLINYCYALPTNHIVYLIMHEEKNDMGESKPKTIGKLLDDKVCIEGLFTIGFRSIFLNGRYVFKTKTDGLDVCKTPMGLFENSEIDNDLKAVDDILRKAYSLYPLTADSLNSKKNEKKEINK